MFLCSHKDITKQKLHEQQQHQLAQLHAQKYQLQLAAAAAASHAADHTKHHGSEQSDASARACLPDGNPPASSTSERLVAAGNSLIGAGRVSDDEQHQPLALTEYTVLNKDSDALQTIQQQQQQQQQLEQEQQQQQQDRELGDANEAQLTAMANQNALISMDEFGLEDSGAENEFDEADESEDQDKHTASQYSRRRSRAVLYQLSGHYGYRRNVNMKSKLKLNNVSTHLLYFANAYTTTTA